MYRSGYGNSYEDVCANVANLIDSGYSVLIPEDVVNSEFISEIQECRNKVIESAKEYNIKISENQINVLTELNFRYGQESAKHLFEHLINGGKLESFIIEVKRSLSQEEYDNTDFKIYTEETSKEDGKACYTAYVKPFNGLGMEASIENLSSVNIQNYTDSAESDQLAGDSRRCLARQVGIEHDKFVVMTDSSGTCINLDTNEQIGVVDYLNSVAKTQIEEISSYVPEETQTETVVDYTPEETQTETVADYTPEETQTEEISDYVPEEAQAEETIDDMPEKTQINELESEETSMDTVRRDLDLREILTSLAAGLAVIVVGALTMSKRFLNNLKRKRHKSKKEKNLKNSNNKKGKSTRSGEYDNQTVTPRRTVADYTPEETQTFESEEEKEALNKENFEKSLSAHNYFKNLKKLYEISDSKEDLNKTVNKEIDMNGANGDNHGKDDDDSGR